MGARKPASIRDVRGQEGLIYGGFLSGRCCMLYTFGTRALGDVVHICSPTRIPKMIHTWRAHVCIARQLDMGYCRLRACTSVETNVALRSCADLVPSARPGLAVLAGLVCYHVLGTRERPLSLLVDRSALMSVCLSSPLLGRVHGGLAACMLFFRLYK